MDFDSVADELYAAAREDFVALRDSRMKQARATGETDLANSIRSLRKPPLAAWLVNQLVRVQPADIAELRELGDAFREAHQQLSGESLRTLSTRRHELISRLRELARSLAEENGHTVSDTTRQQVQDTFEAALADPEAAHRVELGRLDAPLSTDISAQWLTAAVAPPSSAPPRSAASQRSQAPQDSPAARKARPSTAGSPSASSPGARAGGDTAALDDARDKAAAAARARDDAHRELDEAESRLSRAQQATAQLREQLVEAQRAEQRARTDAATARKAFNAAEHTAALAQRHLHRHERQ